MDLGLAFFILAVGFPWSFRSREAFWFYATNHSVASVALVLVGFLVALAGIRSAQAVSLRHLAGRSKLHGIVAGAVIGISIALAASIAGFLSLVIGPWGILLWCFLGGFVVRVGLDASSNANPVHG